MSDDMKFRWLEAILHSSLHATTKFVGMEIWTHTNKAGENAHPGTKTIAKNLNISLRTVNTHIGILRSGGWIIRTTESNKNPSRDWADVYSLNADRVQPRLRTVGADAEADRTQLGADRTQLGADRTQPMLRTNKSLPPSLYQNSDPEGSGSTSQSNAPADFPASWNEQDFTHVEAWLNKNLGLDEIETRTAWQMWEDGSHPKAIFNKIQKDRGEIGRSRVTEGAAS